MDTPIRIEHVANGFAPEAEMNPNVLYVRTIDDDPEPFSCALLCPCGCGEMLEMMLQELHGNDRIPVWTLTAGPNNEATLLPSVNRTWRCRSHFWLKRGRIEWCGKPIPRDKWES